jgi:hypothetical protein
MQKTINIGEGRTVILPDNLHKDALAVLHKRYPQNLALTYKLISSPSASGLEQLVNTALQEGWTLTGPPTVGNDGRNAVFLQALTKKNN